MATAFTDGLKQRFAGELSENETILCSSLQALFHALLNGQLDFEAVMVFLWADLRVLRKFNFDAEAATESGEFDPALKRWPNSGYAGKGKLTDTECAFANDNPPTLFAFRERMPMG